jgi:hypothetical protein
MVKLVENKHPLEHYKLLCNGETIIKGTYEKILQLVFQVIRPGDTYQEFHGSEHVMPLLDYDAVMEQEQLTEAFDHSEKP